MKRILKKCLIFSLMLLPAMALADVPSNLKLFTPTTNDFSINLLERTFGSVGNVLHGGGNQIIGVLLGIFNAMWVVVIGLGILFVVWDSVMSAAHSGEMMQGGRGRRAIFTILRIVIGFCLVLPSKSTGYSLAQTGVMWVVVQGVGLADDVTQKIHTYLEAGGQTFTPKPSGSTDIEPLMPRAAEILKSEVCMFKMQDILDQKKKEEDDALKEAGQKPNPASESDKMGYSINAAITHGSVTFGSKNPNYSPDDPASTRYLNECGQVTWELNVALPLYNRTTAVSTKKTLGGYMKAGVTQLVVDLQPIARELASADLADTEENAATFKQIAQRAGAALAGSGASYATLLDPVKNASEISKNKELQTRLANLNNSGWIFTPIMVITPGLSEAKTVALISYMPQATAPDLSNAEASGKLKVLEPAQKQQIIDLMGHVDSDKYVTLANDYLKLMDKNNEWPRVDFKAIYMGSTTSGYSNNFNVLFDGAKEVMRAGEKAANAMLMVPKGMLMGIYSVADLFVSGFDLTIPGTGIDGIPIPGFGGDLSGLKEGISAISDLQSSTTAAVDGALSNLNDLISDIQGSDKLAEKGGMTAELQTLTEQVGPLGPLFAQVMTAMIGKSMASFDRHLFKSDYNALVSSIQLGGELMVGAMESSFLAGKIMFVSSLVQAGINGLSQAVGALPYGGKVIGGVMDTGTNLVHKGIEGFSTFQIALAALLFSSGLLLYILVPLTFIVAFAAICLRWIGMVLINILGAPIFCFNLIRSEGEGFIGRGEERYLGDVVKTALTPAILAIGAVAFLIFFNIGFMIVTTIFSSFIPLLAKAFNASNGGAILVPVSLAILLMAFATMLVYISQTLSTLCTTEFVNNVTGTIGETIQHLRDTSPAQEIRGTIESGGGQGGKTMKGMAGGKGMMPKQ